MIPFVNCEGYPDPTAATALRKVESDMLTIEEYKKLSKQTKYRNRKVVNACGTFDSVKEYNHWAELRSLELIGAISNLRRQVRYQIIPEQRDKGGKVLEHARYYIADFVYDKNGETVVVDVKGYRTDVYRLKRALMLYQHGIVVMEI